MRPITLFTATVAMAATVACGGERAANDNIGAENSAISTQNENRAPTVGTAGGDTPDASVRQFVEDMAHAGMAEVELGRMANQRGSAAAVKEFGQMMVTDHSKAGEELRQAATGSNIAMPTGMDEKHRDLSERLSKLSGADFDREYMSAMVTGHQEVVEKLERQSRATGNAPATGGENTTGTAMQEGAARGDATPRGDTSTPRGDASTQGDAAITQWAAKTLPAAQRHLERARQIQKQIAG